MQTKRAPTSTSRALRRPLRGAVSRLALIVATAGFGALQAGPALAACATDGGSAVCSGELTTGQLVNSVGPSMSVTTTAGFSVDTGDATALTIQGTGALSYIDANASSLDGGTTGLFMQMQGGSGDLTIETAGAIRGGNTGILTTHFGTGNTSITATGDATGGGAVFNAAGISALAAGGGGNVTVNAVNASGVQGVLVENRGGGAVTITTTGLAAGSTGFGISAFNSTAGLGGDIAVNAVNASGVSGIGVENRGTGTSAVTATGLVTSSQRAGISVINGATAGDVMVNVVDVTGGGSGVVATNNGRGATQVTATGTVTGLFLDPNSPGGNAITVTNAAGGTDVVVSAFNATGGRGGINATNNGSGETRITATGDVVGLLEAGVTATNFAAATNVSVDVVNVTGATRGVLVSNSGQGTSRVTSTGLITGREMDGVRVAVGETAGDVIVDVASVTGAEDGLRISNLGAGATRITATGAVTGLGRDGINIENFSTTTDLVINAVDVTGDRVGILALHDGTGSVSITTTGLVTAGRIEGVRLFTGVGTVGDVTLSVADVRAGRGGVNVESKGSGTVRITATGDVVGGLENFGRGVNLIAEGDSFITLNNVTGDSGLVADVRGDLTIVTTGDMEGATGDGIFARTLAGGGDLTITALNARGERYGIVTNAQGAGVTRITATGEVHGAQIGVYGFQGAASGDLFIDVNNVSGEVGVFAENFSTGEDDDDDDNPTLAARGLAEGEVAESSGSAATVTTRGFVEGSTAAVRSRAMTGQVFNLINFGTVRNASGLSSDLAVTAEGGPVTITNNGTLLGTIAFKAFEPPIDGGDDDDDDGDGGGSGDGGSVGLATRMSALAIPGPGDDVFGNNGEWNSIGGVNDFGAGDDRLVNSATGVLRGAVSAATAETTTYVGLELLSNAGLISLRDGGVGDLVHTDGDAVFAGGSVLSVDLKGTSGSDLFVADGVTTIASGARLQINAVGPLVLGSRYTVLQSAGGVAGTFAFDDVRLSAFTGLRDGYTPTTAFVEYAQVRAFAEAALTRNQASAATAADALPNANPVKAAVLVLADDATARGAFDRLSGEVHPSIAGGMTEDSRLPRNAVLDRLSRSGERSAWGQVFGNWGDGDGDGNTADMRRKTAGVLLGADARIGEAVTLGVAAGYVDTDVSVPQRASNGDLKTVHVLGYAGFQTGPLRFRLGAGYAKADIDTRRTVAFPGFSDRLTASYEGTVLQGFAEAGYRAKWGEGYIEPFVGVAVVRTKTDAFVEAGGPAALRSGGEERTVTLSTLGARFEVRPAAGFSLGGMVGWRHGFDDIEPTSRLAFAGGGGFLIQGVSPSRDVAVVDVRARVRLAPRVSGSLSYDGVLGDGGQDHAVKVGITMVF